MPSSSNSPVGLAVLHPLQHFNAPALLAASSCTIVWTSKGSLGDIFNVDLWGRHTSAFCSCFSSRAEQPRQVRLRAPSSSTSNCVRWSTLSQPRQSCLSGSRAASACMTGELV